MAYRQKELQRQLGVTYKCAFRMGHQLRELMSARLEAAATKQLSGHVEVDETYVGGYQKREKRGYGTNKTIVMGFMERGGDYRAEVVPANTKARLAPRVLKNVATGSTVNTDSLHSYRTLDKLGYTHVAVNHEIKEWAKGIHNTNGIGGFWSHLKRGLSSTPLRCLPEVPACLCERVRVPLQQSPRTGADVSEDVEAGKQRITQTRG